MLEKMTLEELTELHGLMYDAAEANRNLTNGLLKIADKYQNRQIVVALSFINSELNKIDTEAVMKMTEMLMEDMRHKKQSRV